MAALALSLAGGAQPTPKQYGESLGRDAVMMDNDGLCNRAGWAYGKQSTYELAIIRKELKFRGLKGDLPCARKMVEGIQEAEKTTREHDAWKAQQNEQEARAARAATY